jgi:Flp pilus assembly protein TadD
MTTVSHGVSIEQAMALGVQHHNADRLQEAEEIYRQVLKIDPSQPDVLHFLGVIAYQVEKNTEAFDLITKSLAIKSENAEAHCNLGLVLDAMGRLEDALISFNQAIYIKSGFAEAYFNLANTLEKLGKKDESIAHYQNAIAINPGFANAHNNLGNALKDIGDIDSAISHFNKAIKITPDLMESHNNLGFIFHELGRLTEAEQCFRSALALNPESPVPLNNLGNVLKDIAYNRERVRSLKVSEQKSDIDLFDPSVNTELWDEVLSCADKALSLRPGNTDALALKSAWLLSQKKGEEWSSLVDFDRLIETQMLRTPSEYSNIKLFNEALLQSCVSNPNQQLDPFGKSIRMGQRVNYLHQEISPSPVWHLLNSVNTCVIDYLIKNPVDPQHPYLSQVPEQWEITAFGSILGAKGYHESHIHGGGWLSGVYYGKVPAITGMENGKREGWIEFGRPKNYFVNQMSPKFRLFQPNEGMMILFPSYFYHRTIPLKSDDTRFSISFDINPLRVR